MQMLWLRVELTAPQPRFRPGHGDILLSPTSYRILIKPWNLTYVSPPYAVRCHLWEPEIPAHRSCHCSYSTRYCCARAFCLCRCWAARCLTSRRMALSMRWCMREKSLTAGMSSTFR